MIPPAIAPVGLTSGEVLPGIYLEVNFAQGSGLGAGLRRAILVLANKTAAGTATPDTVLYGPDTPVPLVTDAEMRLLGGPGSEAHRLHRRMAAITGGGNGPPVYWLFVTESVGAKASGSFTIATTATGNATHRTTVGDEFVDTGINAGDTVQAIAEAIAVQVNAKTHWPVTAAAAIDGAGPNWKVTLTAKQNGLRGNWTRFVAQIITNVSIGTTTTGTTWTFLTGGTTADSNATALTTIAARRFGYIVSAAEDATQVGALKSQVITQALAINGIRQRIVFGSIDTPANAITIAVGVNAERGECVHSEKSPWTPAEIAANNAMIYALEEADELGFRTNFIGYGSSSRTAPLWKVPAPTVQSAWPTPATQRSLLQNGITPIAVNPTGSTYIVDRFNTRSLNGATPETRSRESHKITICDRFADRFSARLAEAGEGKVIGDDLPNNQPPLPNMFTPRDGRRLLTLTLDEFAANSKIQSGIDPTTGQDRLKQQKDGSQVQRETNPPSRMGVRVPLQTIDNLRQFAVIVDQVA